MEKSILEIIKENPFDAVMKGLLIVTLGFLAYGVSLFYESPVYAAFWDGLFLGSLPCCIIYLWYVWKVSFLNIPENLKEDKSEKYLSFFLVVALVVFCLVRADITGGFISSYYGEDIKPNGVWNLAGVFSLVSGIPVSIASWRKLRRLKKQEKPKEKGEYF